jgi:citrate synthase
MNERIKELAKQAHFDEDGGHLMVHGVYVTTRLEKFAELLVKECTGICKEHEEMYAMLAPTDPTFAAMTTAMGVADKKIREHFGVEL